MQRREASALENAGGKADYCSWEAGEWARGRKWDGVVTCVSVHRCVCDGLHLRSRQETECLEGEQVLRTGSSFLLRGQLSEGLK